MSLEQAMEKLAEAFTKNAAATNKHTEVLQACLDQGIAFALPASTAEETTKSAKATSEKPKAADKAKAAAEKAKAEKEKAKADEGDDDDFGDEGEGDDFGDEGDGDSKTKITADQIKALLFKVKEEKDADTARAILTELGVKTIAQIPEKDFEKTVKLAAKKGVKL